jgi:hypothetical protein
MEHFPHFFKELRSAVRLREDGKAFKRLTALEPVVIKEAANYQNAHAGAFIAQVFCRVMTRHT